MAEFEQLEGLNCPSNKHHREPSKAEAEIATKEMDILYSKITEVFKDDVVDIFRIGSSFWGRNYSLRGKESACPSDLDVEIIFDSIPEPFLTFLDETEISLMREFESKTKAGQVDYLAIKKRIKGIDISFHLTSVNSFNKICNLDYSSISEPLLLNEFRIIDQVKPKRYIQKNFAGDEYVWETSPVFLKSAQISEIPLVGLGNQGELILGTILNKYLPIPELTNFDLHISEGLNRLVVSLRKRKNLDQGIMPERHLSFKNFHYAADRMPLHVIESLASLD